MMSSTIPWAKYSCSGSLLILLNGRTATESPSGMIPAETWPLSSVRIRTLRTATRGLAQRCSSGSGIPHLRTTGPAWRGLAGRCRRKCRRRPVSQLPRAASRFATAMCFGSTRTRQCRKAASASRVRGPVAQWLPTRGSVRVLPDPAIASKRDSWKRYATHGSSTEHGRS